MMGGIPQVWVVKLMLVLIGSYALNAHLPRLQQRKINDIDAIADYQTAIRFLQAHKCVQMYPIQDGKKLYGRRADGMHIEVEIAWDYTTAKSFIENLGDDFQFVTDMDTNVQMAVPSLDLLYALKMSHRYLKDSPFFLKTRNDIMFMRTLGARIPDAWLDWFKTRERETYHYQLPNLDRDKSEFFVDLYQFDHDTIHEAVAIYEQPAYTYYQHDGLKGVQCSRRMFEECSNEIRLAGVVEEASVLALERSLIPHPGKKTDDEAFEFALQKVCTSITSGWFREYSYWNYEAAIALYKSRDKTLSQLFQEGLTNGVIKENVDFPLNNSRKL